VIGAVHLDAGYAAAEALVHRLFEAVEINPQMPAAAKDPKTELQEWLQGRKLKLPVYRVAGTWAQHTSRPLMWNVKSRAGRDRARHWRLASCRRAGRGGRNAAQPESKDQMTDATKNVAPHADSARGQAKMIQTLRQRAVGQRCGVMAIVGKPNVGKSTLLNALVGQKISITSRKAQTTRHRITGIRTLGATQFIFVDTPGFQTRHATALNRSLNKTVMGAIGDVDLVLFVVEAGNFTLGDAKVLSLLKPARAGAAGGQQARPGAPTRDLAPWLRDMQQRHPFSRIRAHVGQERQGRGAAVRHL
jgi:hypothetical protein